MRDALRNAIKRNVKRVIPLPKIVAGILFVKEKVDASVADAKKLEAAVDAVVDSKLPVPASILYKVAKEDSKQAIRETVQETYSELKAELKALGIQF